MDRPIELFTVKETARKLRLSISKIYRMICTGELPCYEIGSRKLIAQADIVQFLTAHRKEVDKMPKARNRHF